MNYLISQNTKEAIETWLAERDGGRRNARGPGFAARQSCYVKITSVADGIYYQCEPSAWNTADEDFQDMRPNGAVCYAVEANGDDLEEDKYYPALRYAMDDEGSWIFVAFAGGSGSGGTGTDCCSPGSPYGSIGDVSGGLALYADGRIAGGWGGGWFSPFEQPEPPVAVGSGVDAPAVVASISQESFACGLLLDSCGRVMGGVYYDEDAKWFSPYGHPAPADPVSDVFSWTWDEAKGASIAPTAPTCGCLAPAYLFVYSTCGIVLDECGRLVGGYSGFPAWGSLFGASDPSWQGTNQPT